MGKPGFMRFLAVLGMLLIGQLLLGGPPPSSAAQATEPVARGILFWSNGCSHCRHVVETVLPPLRLRYGSRLDIRLINISEGENRAYFTTLQEIVDLAPEQRGVPTLFMGEDLYVGADEIAANLPPRIDQCLAQGGCDWPALANLSAHVNLGVEACSPSTPCPTPSAGAAPAGAPTTTGLAVAAATAVIPTSAPPAVGEPGERAFDGFWLGAGVMALLVLAVLGCLAAMLLTIRGRRVGWGEHRGPIAVAVLAVLGLGVAGYLTFVETTNTAPVCGPVGDCDSVQSSPYAVLFGFLPVGLLGMIGYAAILAAALVAGRGQGAASRMAKLAILALSFFGVLYSIYLTYLELAVIRAVCSWCLTSAVIMALVFALGVGMTLGDLAVENVEDDPAEE